MGNEEEFQQQQNVSNSTAPPPPSYSDSLKNPDIDAKYPKGNYGDYTPAQPVIQPTTVPINMPVTSVPIRTINNTNLVPFCGGLCMIHPEHKTRHILGTIGIILLVAVAYLARSARVAARISGTGMNNNNGWGNDEFSNNWANDDWKDEFGGYSSRLRIKGQ